MNGHGQAALDNETEQDRARQIAGAEGEYQERMASMGLTGKYTEAGDFENHPEGGPFSAVCVDMEYLGLVHSELYGDKEMIRYHICTTERMGDGRPFWLAARYNLSLSAMKGKESNLYKALTSWLGKPPVTKEKPLFDFSSMVGKPCLVTVTHTTKGDRTFANIATITALMKGMAPLTLAETGYTRRFDADGLPLDPQKRAAFLASDAFATPASEPNPDADDPLDSVPF